MSSQAKVKKRKRETMGLRVKDPAFEGFPRHLPPFQLPTYQDIGLALEEYYREKVEKPELAVTHDIMVLYEKASIPTITKGKIYLKVKNVKQLKLQKLKDLTIDKKSGKVKCQGKVRRKSKNGKVRTKLGDVLYKLFPVADENNIPEREKEFFEDQNGLRERYIGSIDPVVTASNEKVYQRKLEIEERENKEKQRLQQENQTEIGTYSSDDSGNSILSIKIVQ